MESVGVEIEDCNVFLALFTHSYMVFDLVVYIKTK